MASLGRKRSYFEFMRESIISGIKEYRPMKSKHCNAVGLLAYLVNLWMKKTDPNKRRCQCGSGGSAGMSLRGCWEWPPGAPRRPDMSGTVLSQRETADWVARNPGHPASSGQHVLCAVQCTWLEGKGAKSFWLGLGGWDKRISVCQSVFPWPLRTSLKHKLASLMNPFPSHWPLLQNDIVNQAKYRGIRRGRVSRPLCECRGTFNGEWALLGHRSKWTQIQPGLIGHLMTRARFG